MLLNREKSHSLNLHIEKLKENASQRMKNVTDNEYHSNNHCNYQMKHPVVWRA